jgi:hypothetical protein
MQLMREKADYDLPEDFGEVVLFDVADTKTSVYTRLMVIDAGDMKQLRKEGKAKIIGVPVYASVVDGRLWVYPAPDHDYPSIVRYIPAPKEL